MNKKILIIDDEDDIRSLIEGILEDEGYLTLSAKNSDEAYEHIRNETPDLVIQDIWLQGSEHDGLEILKNVKTEAEYLPFIMISGHGTIETAVSAIKKGAYDFIEKPFNSDRLLLMVHRALEKASLKKENQILKQKREDHVGIAKKYLSKENFSSVEKVAKTNSRVFLTGEVGTGKNIAAQALHECSERKDAPFMTLHCSGKSAQEIEEELFGCAEEGRVRISLLSLVNSGTLLLDEVMSLPPQVQGRVLAFLQENAYCPIGSNKKENVDVRVISTCSSDFEAFLDNGEFRQDLFYRLNVVNIDIAPLRERRESIAELLSDYRLSFSECAVNKMQYYSWPGNVKQFYNILEYLQIMHNAEVDINAEDIAAVLEKRASNDSDPDGKKFDMLQETIGMGLRDAREFFERRYLVAQLEKFGGNISKTATFIGMERSALHRKLKSLDVFSDDKQNVA